MRYLILLIILTVALGATPGPAPAQTLFALVDTGELFVSDDDGSTWSIRSTLPASDAVALIAGGGPTELYLACVSGTVYRSSDAGLTWTARGSVGAPDVVALAGRTDGMLLVLTRSGTVYASADQGATFSARGQLTASNLVSLTRDSDDRCYALTETGQVARSNDGGLNWIVVGAMTVPDAVAITAVGTTLFALNSTGIAYRSTDFGASWSAGGTVSQVGMVSLVEGNGVLIAASREGMVASSRNSTSWTWIGAINQLNVTALANDTPQTIGVPPGGGHPGGFTLAPPWPNPLPRSDGRIGVTITLPEPAAVTLRLFDAAGRLVDERAPQQLGEAGERSLSWRPATPGAGVYFLRVSTDRGGEAAHRVVMLP